MNQFPNKNYFTMPNEIFSLGLNASEIAVYAYLTCIQPEREYLVRHCEIVFVGDMIHKLSSFLSGWKSWMNSFAEWTMPNSLSCW